MVAVDTPWLCDLQGYHAGKTDHSHRGSIVPVQRHILLLLMPHFFVEVIDGAFWHTCVC